MSQFMVPTDEHSTIEPRVMKRHGVSAERLERSRYIPSDFSSAS